MSKNHKRPQPARRQPAAQAAPHAAGTPRKPRATLFTPGRLKWAAFALLVIFCTVIYGDVFARAEQESYILPDAASMKFLTDKPFGTLYVVGRWMLLAFKSKWVGGLLLASILTATACQLAYILRLPARWKGLAMLLPLAELAWMVSEGTNLYYKFEPSRFVLLAVGTFAALLVVALACRLLRRKKPAAGAAPDAPAPAAPRKSAWPGYAVGLAAYAAVTLYAVGPQQNAILVAQMQQQMWQQDWEGMVQKGLSARRASRPVATYYAIGLLRQDRLLDELFDLRFKYPNDYLKNKGGRDEYNIMQADADFAAGLVQPAYHYALEFMVMNGPSVYYMKRAAVSALMMGQSELCRKYLDILERIPFEKSFADRYRPMLTDPKLIGADAELAAVRALIPKESRFEQNYRQPIFLGYNMGLQRASNETLPTSIAACLYSKDLKSLIARLEVLQASGQPIPRIAQQALLCYSIKHPEVLKAFPVSRFAQSELQAFLTDAAPYVKGDKEELAEKLREQWLGSYMYYYYCENNDSIATGKGAKKGGVN